MWLAALVLCFGLVGDEIAPVDVEVTPSTVERISYDPKNRPSTMPTLSGNEAALTQYKFLCQVKLKYQIVESREFNGGVRVTADVGKMLVTLKLEQKIFQPFNTNQKLREHEEGHRDINERVYKEAETAAREEAEKVMAKQWVGTGVDLDAAGKDATDRAIKALGDAYLARISAKAWRIGDIYDELTDHGRNGRPVIDAIRKSFERYRTEPATTRSS